MKITMIEDQQRFQGGTRLIYEGPLQQAQCLLQDVRYGKDDFARFMDVIQKLSYNHTKFFGDVSLPSDLKSQIQDKSRSNLEDRVELPVLPSFYLQDFKICSEDEERNGEPGYKEISYDIRRSVHGPITAAEIRIEDTGIASEGYLLGQELATVIPSAVVLYHNKAQKRGWETILKGHFFDEGNIVVAAPGTAEHAAMERKEQYQFDEACKRVLAATPAGEHKQYMTRLLSQKGMKGI